MPPSSRTYCVVLRDEHLGAEIPLYIDFDELDVFTTPPLSFELSCYIANLSQLPDPSVR
ncbi:MAG: hypothetical protein IIA41_12945 [SAR324 cluster bacterium]|nr:hypothetical protein [SAR324 cluster bacterium]